MQMEAHVYAQEKILVLGDIRGERISILIYQSRKEEGTIDTWL